ERSRGISEKVKWRVKVNYSYKTLTAWNVTCFLGQTEDEVTPGEPMAKPKTEKKAAIAAPVSRYCRWIFSWATASSTSEASGGSATKTRRLADRRAFVDSPSSTRGLPAPRRRLSEWL